MIVEERKKRLRDIIQKNKFVSLQELKKATQTSLSTVRRDLADLAAEALNKSTVEEVIELVESIQK